jgi:hypothetical protein
MSDRSFSDLLSAVYCPICGGKLHVDESEGKRRLLCDRHGEMRVYVEYGPRRGSVGDVCRSVGVKDLEAP